MWRSPVVSVCTALALFGLRLTSDVGVLKPQSVSAQVVSPMELVHESIGDLSSHPKLLPDTRIESPAPNDNAVTLPEKKAGDSIQFQFFVPEARGTQIQGYTVELSLRGKTFGSYIGVRSNLPCLEKQWNQRQDHSYCRLSGLPTGKTHDVGICHRMMRQIYPEMRHPTVHQSEECQS